MNPGGLQKEPNSIVAYPDFGQLAEQRTSGMVMEYFLKYLFKEGTKLNYRSIFMLLRTLFFALTLKVLLDDTKTYVDKFKFTDIDYLKYLYQYLRYSVKTYEILNISNKWVYCDKNISIATLTPFLERKSIYIQQPNTYYYSYNSFLIKVVITNNKIIFYVPNVASITKYMDDNIDIHQEILLGNKTSMLKVTLTSNNIPQFTPMKSIYAFETDDYFNLHKSLTSTFINDSIVNMRQSPLILNFDGKPGTGKTTFGSYIADKGLFDRIFLYNLVQSGSMDFKTIVIDLERIINSQSPKEKKPDDEPELILLIFDEVDKYLDSYVCNKIDSFRNDARMKKETKQNNDSTIESFIKLTAEEEVEKKQQLINEFLDILYNLCDGHLLKNDKKYVIIFNTNDFDSLFVNAPKKYDALRDRFQPYKFTDYTKTQVVKFIEDIRNKLMDGSRLKITDKKREIYESYIKDIKNFDNKLYNEIPDNIEISSRSLSKVLIDNCFDIPKVIERLAIFAKVNIEIKSSSEIEKQVIEILDTL